MFYPLYWFTSEEDLIIARNKLLAWATGKPLLAYLNSEGDRRPGTLEEKKLSAQDQDLLLQFFDKSRESFDLAGFTSGRSTAEINGFCYFSVDEKKREACLEVMLVPSNHAVIPPLRSPVLSLALTELLGGRDGLQRVFLPFYAPTGTASEENPLIFSLFDLEPSPTPGWWQKKIEAEFSLESCTLPSALPEGDWLELSVEAEEGITPFLSSVFYHFGFNHQVISEFNSQDTLQPIEPVTTAKTAVVRTYIPFTSTAEEIISAIYEVLSYMDKISYIQELKVAIVSPGQWQSIWGEHNIFRAGRKTVVTLLYPDYKPEPGEVVVDIIPYNRVFSFCEEGLHPTTRLMLEMMEDFLDPNKHRNLCDLGTGSGVLAIWAAKMGASQVLALDAFDDAVNSAVQNIARNDQAGKITARLGSLAVLEQYQEKLYNFPPEDQEPPVDLAAFSPFDAILANIYDPVLIPLAEILAGNLLPGGLLIASGIRTKKNEEVAAAFKAARLELLNIRSAEGWMAFTYLKPEITDGPEPGGEEKPVSFLDNALKW